MGRKLFGTDGIRGRANVEPITPAIAMAVAMASGARFHSNHGRRNLVLIAKDTRLSGYMLETAMAAGFTSIGMDVVLVGPMPAPAVAMLVQSMRANLGVMISASHNPYYDNGIKLFGPDGYKLSDEVETEIEEMFTHWQSLPLSSSEALGKASRLEDQQGRYIEFVKSSFPRDLRLDGLKVVIDCANGAAYKAAPRVLFELGAEVISMGVSPDGFNINDGCGATAPEAMIDLVRNEGADVGISLDGDADRLILADETGHKLDGDQILGLIGSSWLGDGRLSGGGIVATVMSNLGLENYLKGIGLKLVRAKVGDRYVLEAMRAGGYNVGGEQSGHMILADYGTTGDGLAAALQVLAAMKRAEKPLSQVSKIFEPMPQILRNVRFAGEDPLAVDSVKSAIASSKAKFADNDHLVIRKSGTEPLIRVMAQGENEIEVLSAVEMVVEAIEQVAKKKTMD
ncbi:phosphoglucosamine mutase [Candidatus Endolissoclinum faulkneri L2]|uniref:Phosphoglucosamine mutase n=1 Tax=Candidatus Endolissoclinum faulkneri L2 TaxID=1193729 RepID=K7Z3Y1_9PROT|nr:phosphoglucosamine mutase [Candidatus Endolissoclinum faulkneri]AFX98713.1 phosphoglucosamine mutase [Candidatus Endolissoclinum faulkneri L2]